MAEYRGCELPEDLYYDLDYIWARPEAGDRYRIGVTDPSQTMGGRIQSVLIREVGRHRKRKQALAVVESGKWVGGIPAPFDGTIVERNEKVVENPLLINIAPYTEAWIVVMQPDDPATALAHLATGAEAQRRLREWIDRYNVQCMRCAE